MKKKRRIPHGAKRVDLVSQKSDIASEGLKQAAELRIYQEKPGDVPFFDFFNERKNTEKASIVAALEQLQQKGHLLRPPHNEHLGDQLYYLRIQGEDGTYRLFYWPSGRGIVVLGHGFSKKANQCPPEEIRRALKQRDRYTADPGNHTFKGKFDG